MGKIYLHDFDSFLVNDSVSLSVFDLVYPTSEDKYRLSVEDPIAHKGQLRLSSLLNLSDLANSSAKS